MSHNGDEYAAVRNAQIRDGALHHVRSAYRDVETANHNLREMIVAAKSFGATWDDVGEILGVSRQIAWKRYRRYVGGDVGD